MGLTRRVLMVAVSAVFFLCVWVPIKGVSGGQVAAPEDATYQDLPMAFTCPLPEGQGGVATVRIVVDAKGNVIDAKALDGQPQVLQQAEACAKTWKYQHPPSSAISKIVEISYSTRLCPAKESQRGDLQWSWSLQNKKGQVVAYLDGDNPPKPVYPEEERKAGTAGRMILAVSLNPDGTVKDVHALRGLSPGLEKSMIDMILPMKFRIFHDEDSQPNLTDLIFYIDFRPICPSQTVHYRN